MPTQNEKTELIRKIAAAILEAIDTAGDMGAPSSHLYLALSTSGASIEQYQSFMDGLEESGLVTCSHHSYQLTTKGRDFLALFNKMGAKAPIGEEPKQ